MYGDTVHMQVEQPVPDQDLPEPTELPLRPTDLIAAVRVTLQRLVEQLGDWAMWLILAKRGVC